MIRRLLSAALLLTALLWHPHTARAQAPEYVYCITATSTMCNTVANPGNGTQGDPAWLAFGKANLNFAALQPPTPQYSLVFSNNANYGGLLPGSNGIWCLQWTSLSAAPTLVACPGSGTSAFGSLTSGTNVAATMVVGTGSSMGPAGSGVLNANQVNGATVPLSAAALATNGAGQLTAAPTFGTGSVVLSGALGTFASQNFATPPTIGGTTPAPAKFSALTLPSISGSTQALQVDNTGLVSGSGAPPSTLTQFSGVTTPTTLSPSNQAVTVNAASAPVTITLPTAVGANFEPVVKKVDNSTNIVTVATTSAQTIDGAASYSISAQYGSLIFKSDNANWWIKAGYPPSAVAPGQTLLSYINSLGVGSPNGAMVGVYLNPFSATPLDSINTSTTTYGSLTQACGYASGTPCGTNTGALPGIVAIFAACAGNISGITNIGGGGCNIEATNTAPNDWLSLAQGAQSAGYIVDIIWVPNNPAGSGGSPWPNVITNNGNSTYAQYQTWLAQLATDLKTLTKPFIFSPVGELNLPCGTPGTCLTYGSGNWEAIDAQSSGIPTSSENTALFNLQVSTLRNAGVTNMLVNFETNFGLTNNCYGFPSSADVDMVSADYQPGTYNNSSDYNTLTGAGNCGHNYPFIVGSVASSGSPDSESPGTVNTYTAINECIAAVCPGGANSPSAGLYVGTKAILIWGQGSALPQQNGAAAALTTSPWINKSSLPSAGFSGPKYRGHAGDGHTMIWVDAGVGAANDEVFEPRRKVVGF